LIVRNIIGSMVLAIVFVVVGLFALKKTSVLPSQFTLLIHPEGTLVEMVSIPTLEEVIKSSQHGQIPVAHLVEMLKQATNDDRVTQVILDMSDLIIDSWGSVAELYAALKIFKAGDKPLHVFSHDYNNVTYLLASIADSIWLDSFGEVDINGFRISQLYFKEAFDKYGIEPHYVRAGMYKSALEPLTASHMSEASREMYTDLIESSWRYYRSQVATNRGVSESFIDEYSHNWVSLFARQSQQSAALLAQEQGLVHKIGSMQDLFREVVPTIKIDSFMSLEDNADLLVDGISYMSGHSYAKNKKSHKSATIGLIHANGEIRQGFSSPGVLGSKTLIAAIEQAVNNDVSALVIRMDSPGGDAYASEEVYRVMMNVRKNKGIPIVMSVGSTAASGAYWIGLAADKIVATELSLTGSIGVFTFMLSAHDLSREWGITSDSVATHSRKMGGTIADRISPELLLMHQTSVNFIYNNFLDRVVVAQRATNRAEADKLAQGRVYGGQEAFERGLVDELGTLADAFELAAHLAKLEEWQIHYYEPTLSMADRLMALVVTQPTSSIGYIMSYWEKQSQAQAIDLTKLS
jgi:protease-4